MLREYDDLTLRKLQNVELEILKDFIKICDEHNLEYFGIGGTAIGAIRHKGFIPWDDDIDVALRREDYNKLISIVKKDFSDKYIILNAEENKNYPLMTTRMMKKGTKFREYPLKDINCELGIFLDIYSFDNISDDPKAFRKQAIEAWFWSKIMILRSIPFPVLPFKGLKGKLVHAICALIHYSMVILRVPKGYLYKRCDKVVKRFNNVKTKRIAYLCDTNPYGNIIDLNELYPLKEIEYEDVKLKFPHNIHELLESYYGDYMQLPPEDKRKNHYPYILEFGDN